MIKLFIEGVPIAQGRARGRSAGKRVIMYDPAKSRKWKQEVARQALSCGYGELKGALKMRLEFYMPRPKSLPRSVKFHRKKPDCDNLAKAVKDGMEGIFYRNDSQVCQLEIEKLYCMEGEKPGVNVTIEELENGEN